MAEPRRSRLARAAAPTLEASSKPQCPYEGVAEARNEAGYAGLSSLRSARGHQPDRAAEGNRLTIGEWRQNLSDRNSGRGTNLIGLAVERAARRPDLERARDSRIETAADGHVEH